MYIDSDLEFADGLTFAAATTGSVAAHDCSNYVDLDAAGRLEGEPLYLVILVTTDCTSGGSATITFDLETDTDSTFSAGATNLWSSPAIAVATMEAGYRIVVPVNMVDAYQYLNLEYTIAEATFTAGAFDAFITKDVPADA